MLSSVHQAKGLEWRAVFVVWLADGRFPSAQALKDRDGEEEERRLFYVACTRAKDELYLTYPVMAAPRDRERVVMKASRFLEELPAEPPLCDRWQLDDGLAQAPLPGVAAAPALGAEGARHVPSLFGDADPGEAPGSGEGGDVPFSNGRVLRGVGEPCQRSRMAGPREKAIIGIDLGTTNACVAHVRNRIPRAVPTDRGNLILPSVVALSDRGDFLVGGVAKDQLVTNPRNTIYGAKRLIGRKWNSRVVQELRSYYSYDIVEGPERRGGGAARRQGPYPAADQRHGAGSP